MTKLSSSPSVILVNAGAGATNGSATITYEKNDFEPLFVKEPGKGWEELDKTALIKMMGTVDAEENGNWVIQLKPGQLYEVAIAGQGEQPSTDFEIQLHMVAYLRIGCIWQTPSPDPIFTDSNSEVGGTWLRARVVGTKPTRILRQEIGLVKPDILTSGLPKIEEPVGTLVAYGLETTPDGHHLEYSELLPGHDYFVLVVAMDDHGNWGYLVVPGTTKQRKITVQFPSMVVFNDGDYATEGEDEFNFSVAHLINRKHIAFAAFNRPRADTDDWSETGRPYSLGYAHIGAFEPVEAQDKVVYVVADGNEDDTFGGDKASGSTFLDFPDGRDETKLNEAISLRCPPNTGSTLDFKVNVIYSVEYGP